MNLPSVRQFSKIVFKGHGFTKSPKSSEEADLVFEAKNEKIQDVIDQLTRAFVLYLSTGQANFPNIKVEHSALKDKKVKFIGISHDDNAIVVIVEKNSDTSVSE